MEKYVVDITDEALADMDELYDHIANKLLAPGNAMGQYNRIADAIYLSANPHIRSFSLLIW